MKWSKSAGQTVTLLGQGKQKEKEKTNLAYLSHLYIISSIPAEQSEKKNSWLESSAGVGIAQTVRPTRLRGGGE